MTDKEDILFIYLTPCIPLSFKGEGEGWEERVVFEEASPLQSTPLINNLTYAIISTVVWGYSSIGRALRSHRRGRGFESPYLHQ